MNLRHIPTGTEGKFIKAYTQTGMFETIQIRLGDGRIYFAPSNEFETI